MARLVTCGWETGGTIEGGGALTGSGWTTNTSAPKEGTYNLRCTADGATNQIITYPTGAALGRKISGRVWFKFSAAPVSITSFVISFDSVAGSFSTTAIKLKTDSTLQWFSSGSAVGSASATLATGTWHLLEWQLTIGTGATDAVQFSVNGTSLYSATGISITDTLISSFVGFVCGATQANGSTFEFDGLKINDDQGSSETGLPNAAALALLVPVADSADGSWTKPGGGTTNTYTSIDNIPPVGVADSTSSANAEKQLRNPTANDAYAVALQDYTTAGVSGTVNGLHPIAVTAAPASTGAKTGSLEGVSNPAITALSFGNYHSGTNAGTFPTGWKYVFGTYSASPTVTLGTQPVIRLNITGGTTSRVAMTCFMGMYVEYTASGDVTVNGSGQSVTVARGSVTGSTDVAASGQSATASQGSASASVSVALTGQSLSVARGTVTASGADTVAALTGQSLSVAGGSVAVARESALSGQSLTTAAGTVTAQLATALTGQALTAARDSVLATNSLALSGAALTASQGSVSVAADNVTVALTGQSMSVAGGSVAPAFSLAASGQAASIAGGTIAPATTAAASGQEITAARGSITAATDRALSGQSLALAGGSITPATSLAITGQTLTAAQDSVSAGGDVIRALTGLSVSAAVGSITPSASLAITGNAVSAARGTVAPATSPALSGQAVTAARGSLAPDTARAVTGQDLTAAAGSLAPAIAAGVSGNGAALAQGDVTAAVADVTVALTGQAIGVTGGALMAQSAASLTGAAAEAEQGSTAAATTTAIAGFYLAASNGELLTRPLETYPRDDNPQHYPMEGTAPTYPRGAQGYPTAGLNANYPLATIPQQYPLEAA